MSHMTRSPSAGTPVIHTLVCPAQEFGMDNVVFGDVCANGGHATPPMRLTLPP